MSVEHVLCQIPTCYIFKLPVLTTTRGYTASEMKGNQIRICRLKVSRVDGLGRVDLLETDGTTLFARAPLTDDDVVQRTPDSSRYFAVRVVNPQTNKKAIVGVGFGDRSEAFDFNSALSDAHKYARYGSAGEGDEDEEEQVVDAPFVASDAFALKTTIKVQLNKPKKSAKKSDASSGSTVGISPPPVSGIAPPPSSSKRRERRKK